jgi:predicted alpha/beta superfamily hydrolase
MLRHVSSSPLSTFFRASALYTLFSIAVVPCQAMASSRTGNIETFEFTSEIMENTRNIWVYLPPDYDENESHRYPVFYLQDGQNLMDGNTASKEGHEWGVDESAEQLILSGDIEPLILVGIDHMGDKRGDEYNVVVEKSRGAGPFFNQGGEGELYGYMITDELLPLINSRYRTKTQPHHTAVGGASFGCNISIYLALEYPEHFGNVMAMSCATWFGQLWLKDTVRALPKKKPVRVWLDVGDAEFDNENWNEAEVVRHSELYDSFISKGWAKNDDIFFLVDKDAKHFEDDWGKRFPQVLKWFFPAQ